jgi:hypothetical protein
LNHPHPPAHPHPRFGRDFGDEGEDEQEAERFLRHFQTAAYKKTASSVVAFHTRSGIRKVRTNRLARRVENGFQRR